MMSSLTSLIVLGRCVLLLGFCTTTFLLGFAPAVGQAQVSAQEHASHHPQEVQTNSPTSGEKGSPSGAGGMGNMMGGGNGNGNGSGKGGGNGGGMGGGMGKMMKQMGAPKPKQLYPSLMALPDMPMERRQEVQRQAHGRMKTGAVLMSEGLEALSRAAPSDDYAAMQKALEIVQQGLSRFDSGLAAHRALAEGKAPRNVALRWFKREMNLLPPSSEYPQRGVFGLSWFHLTIMLILILFASAMIVMYFFKMQRAATLLERVNSIGSAKPTDIAATTPAATTSATSATPAMASPDSGFPATKARAEATSHDCCDDTPEAACTTQPPGDATAISKGLLRVMEKKLCRLRVARIVQETPNVKTFRFVACHGGGIPLSFLPGQFLTLTLPVGEKPIRRSYTISSSPTQGYYCEITVKREEHGAGSGYLHDQVKVGDTLEAKAPNGKFIFTGKEADSIVLIGAGVGITPMMSITRAMTDMAWSGNIYFIAVCQDPEHFIFESELKQLNAQYDNLHLFVAMSRIENDVGHYRRGRLSKEMLTQWVPDISSKWIHLCGAPPMMDATKQMLVELGVPLDHVHTENFGSAQKPNAQVVQRQDAPAVEKKAAPVGTVSFSASDISTPFLADETVLEASERVEVDIDYSCRVGTCGECKVKLLSGKVSMETEDGLEPGQKEQGMILACQAKSTTDIIVDA